MVIKTGVGIFIFSPCDTMVVDLSDYILQRRRKICDQSICKQMIL